MSSSTSNPSTPVETADVSLNTDVVQELVERLDSSNEVIAETAEAAVDAVASATGWDIGIEDEAYAKLGKAIEGMNLIPSNMISILRFAMEVVETTSVKGPAQKELAIHLVHRVIDNAPISDAAKDTCRNALPDDVLGAVIDMVILATRGQLSINAAADIVGDVVEDRVEEFVEDALEDVQECCACLPCFSKKK